MKKVLMLSVFILSFSTTAFSESGEDAILAGKSVYSTHCARCHGVNGKGDGMDAKRLVVKPRNLTQGIYKFRSTESGTPPTDEDLMWVLNHGLAGSGMPSFANLSKRDKNNVIAYIKSLSTVFEEYEPVPIKQPDIHAKVDLKEGKEVYDLLQCAKCHGVGGRANGQSADTLVDVIPGQGLPIKAANLTQGWTYRAGKSPQQIYNRLMAGISGTPMPSYDGAVTVEQAWQLANYVAAMQLDSEWELTIQSTKVSESLPTSIKDSAWDSAARTDINMQSQIYRYGRKMDTTINAVSVKAIHNKEGIALKVFWNDPTQSTQRNVDSLVLAWQKKEKAGAHEGNLYTQYGRNAKPTDVMVWKADNPNSVGHGITTLEQANRSGWKPSKTSSAEATYEDGLWSLVLIRPLVGEKIDQIYIGLAAWDGGKRERGNTHGATRWIALNLTPPKNIH